MFITPVGWHKSLKLTVRSRSSLDVVLLEIVVTVIFGFSVVTGILTLNESDLFLSVYSINMPVSIGVNEMYCLLFIYEYIDAFNTVKNYLLRIALYLPREMNLQWAIA